MVTPGYNTVITTLFEILDPLLKQYMQGSYDSIVSYLKVPLGLAITLYIVLFGISIMHGWVKLSMSNFVKSVVKIGLIYTFAMNWSFFSDYVVTLIEGTASDISGTLLEQASNIFHFSTIVLPKALNPALQLVLEEITKIGHYIWAAGSWHSFTPYFSAIMIWFFGFLMLGIAILEILMAKVMMAVLFGLAPLFVGFTLFKPTHNFFDKWIGACVGFSFVLILVSAVLSLALNLMQWSIADMVITKAAHVELVGFVPVMIMGIIGVGTIFAAAKLAMHIGGMVSTSSASSFLAGAVGGAVGGAFAALKLPGGVFGTTKRLFGMGGSAGKGVTDDAASAVNSLRKNLRKGE